MGSLDISNSDQTPSDLESVNAIANDSNEAREHSSTAPDKDVLGLKSHSPTVNNGYELSVHPPTARDKDDVLDLESECATTSNANDLKLHSPTTPEEDKLFDSERLLLSFTSRSSSSSSGDVTLEDPFQDSDSEHDKPSSTLHSNDRLASEHGEKANEQLSDSEIPVSSFGPSDIDHISETPPIQVMERPSSSKYRIPSHVFSRKKSNAAAEWSMYSNESLFSIQMGGMSFCNLDSMVLKSGELGPVFSAETSPSGQPVNFSYDNQFSSGKSTEAGKNLELDKAHSLGESGKSQEVSEADKKNELNGTVEISNMVDETGKTHKLGETGKGEEAGKSQESDKIHELGKVSSNHESSLRGKPADTGLRDNIEDQGGNKFTAEELISLNHTESGVSKFTAEERMSLNSAASAGSTKSFAFPILAGETDKFHSARIGGLLQGVPEKPKLEPQPPHPQPETPPPESQPTLESQLQPQPDVKANNATPTPVMSWTKWFPCFRCCTICSSS